MTVKCLFCFGFLDKSKVNGASESAENNSDLLENSRDSKTGISLKKVTGIRISFQCALLNVREIMTNQLHDLAGLESPNYK